MADGSLRKELEPETAAGCITTLMNGLQLRGKLVLARQQADQTVAMAISAFV